MAPHEGETRRDSRKAEAIVFRILFIQGSFHPLGGGFSASIHGEDRDLDPGFLVKFLGGSREKKFYVLV